MTAAFISSISASIGLVYLMNVFQDMMGDGAVTYAISDYALVFVVILCVAFALVGLILIISTLAKTSRSAQTLAVIPIMVLFIGSFLTSNDGMSSMLAKFGFKNCLIPLWNATYLTKQILLSGVSITEVLLTCVINLAFGLLCLAIVSRLFNNEKIVNE
jgi:ABC-type Na+ efflux pump permease subunit